MSTRPATASLPPWHEQPEVTGLQRQAMAPELAPYRSLADARAGRAPYLASLDGRWRFLLADGPDRVPAGWEATGFDDRRWDPLTVPGAWAMPGPGEPAHDAPAYLNIVMPFGGEPPEVPSRNPTGLYRRTFRVPAGWRRGRRVLLRVGSAESVVHAYVNGRPVGMGKDSRLSSTFDVTGALVPGENVVALAVVQWSDATWLEDQDQWWLGGLHRSVELLSVPLTHLADVGLVPGLDGDGRTGTLDVEVSVGGPDPVPGWTVEVRVETLGGRPVARLDPAEVPCFEHGHPLTELISGAFFAGRTVRARLEVPGVAPWSHEAPHRYRVLVSLRDPSGGVVDVRAQCSGFRSVEVADNELRINGRPVLIVGVNLHEWDPDRGRAVSVDRLRQDLSLMKAHHVNAVRFAHYPHLPAAYDLCDELGLYVIDEANVETHARQASLCHEPRYLGAIVERGVRMVRRDRNHPCIVAWSLGNESGYGAAHDAMAAAIRRLDPSRPLHYEGVLMHDLYHPAPVTDIVCPMYSGIDDIVAWARSGRDSRRPLILCEFSHAMGNSNGSLADYMAAFEEYPQLQGGFIWEWVDHGVRTSAGIAYGGDFDEQRRYGRHDGNFCCDGLVSADREPHPAMAELKALAQPVRAHLERGRVRIEHLGWFTDSSWMEARWERSSDGRVVESGRLDLAPIGPRSSAVIDLPGSAPADHLTLRWRPRRRPPWAPAGWQVGWSQLPLPAGSGPRRAAVAPARRARRSPAVEVGAGGLSVGGDVLGWPELCLWRAPTDNDGIQVGWMDGSGVLGRWRLWGLDRLEVATARSPRSRRGDQPTWSRHTTWVTGAGIEVEHRQLLALTDDGLRVAERVDVPAELDDLPRVGVVMALPADYATVEWLGRGPHETYADRCRAEWGRWRSSVADQYVDYAMPQEHGHHHDTRWCRLIRDGGPALTFGADRPYGFNVGRYSVAQLAAARHAHELSPEPVTWFHLDVAHRGLGTGSCGPDTLPRHRVRGGRHEWVWTMRSDPK